MLHIWTSFSPLAINSLMKHNKRGTNVGKHSFNLPTHLLQILFVFLHIHIHNNVNLKSIGVPHPLLKPLWVFFVCFFFYLSCTSLIQSVLHWFKWRDFGGLEFDHTIAMWRACFRFHHSNTRPSSHLCLHFIFIPHSSPITWSRWRSHSPKHLLLGISSSPPVSG